MPCLHDGEEYVNGETMRLRAKEELGGLTGQHHLERMLRQTKDIPVELREFYLVAPGTLWRDSDGRLCVPFLRWYGGGWVLRFGWLDFGDWDSGARLVRLRK